MSSQSVSLGQNYCVGCDAGDIDGLRVWEFSYDANQIVPRHEHEKAYVCFLLSGDLIETDAREDLTYSKARLVFVPKGQAHAAKIGPHGACVGTVDTFEGFQSGDKFIWNGREQRINGDIVLERVEIWREGDVVRNDIYQSTDGNVNWRLTGSEIRRRRS